MWQLLLAAAAAGSTGFVAKHVLRYSKHDKEVSLEDSISSTFSTPNQNDANYKDGVFRFSSSASSSSRSSSAANKFRVSKKKSAIKGKKLKIDGSNVKESQRSTGGCARRFPASLKKRRTVPVKCGSSVPSHKGTSSNLFGWGLGVGIMYMMSAGKAEISKLSNAMDETSKVVQELRTELCKRRSARVAKRAEDVSCKHTQEERYGSGTVNRDPKHAKVSGVPMNDDIECSSSVLTEEPDPQVLEMDQLEAELVSELQKLPWSKSETSGHEVGSTMDKDELKGQNTVSYQCYGVLPSELDKRLCHLLIGQQENQIEELESELQKAQFKISEKEAELQAMKDCVRRLTEFSLSTVSDDEPEVLVGQDCVTKWDNNGKIESACEIRKSMVGMKRPMDSAQ